MVVAFENQSVEIFDRNIVLHFALFFLVIRYVFLQYV
jgi:hypothetical protein